jgi:hypothetical protein
LASLKKLSPVRKSLRKNASLNRIAATPEWERVYVGECGVKERLQREYGRDLRGVKIEDARGHKFHRVNVAAATAYSKKGTKKTAPECYNGSMSGDRFKR